MYQMCQESQPKCGDRRCSISAAESGEREREEKDDNKIYYTFCTVE